MSADNVTWPTGIGYTAGSVTPSATTGLGKQAVTFTVAADTQPGNWTFKITGTSGALVHSTEVMVICTPSGTTVIPYASPRLDPSTITSSTPMGLEPPWGDKITINSIINDGSEASVITPSNLDIAPDTLASLPEGTSDMLGRITNVESSSPVDGVEWDLGFSFDSANLTAAGFDEENLKVAYLNPDTGTWTEVTTTIDTTNKIAYASPTHFSSWTLIATPTPPSPPSEAVTQVVTGGGGGGNSGTTYMSESITSSGKIIEDVVAKSADGIAELIIPKGTIAKNRWGQAFYSISIKEKLSPEDPPADSQIIGLVYDIGPSGATFYPPIALTFTYSESLIPAGVAEGNLVMATWDNGEWVEIEGGMVDTASNTITVPVSHFSVFTVMAHTNPAVFEISALNLSPTTVDISESVTISATVTNTGDLAGSYDVILLINQEVTATKEVHLSGHSSQQVTFTTNQNAAGTYQVSVNGLPNTFVVREMEVQAPAEEDGAQPSSSEVEGTSEIQLTESEILPTPSEVQPAVPDEVSTPSSAQPTPSTATPDESAAPIVPFNLWLIIGIAAGVIVSSIIIWRLVARSKA